jgi:signal transduction histidine kinase/CheY-like chemotaxis protein
LLLHYPEGIILFLYRCIVFLNLLLLTGFTCAASDTLKNDISKQTSIDIKNIEYVLENGLRYDYERVLGLDDSRWQVPSEYPLNLGVITNGAWVRFNLKNVELSNSEYLLEVSNPGLHNLTVFIKYPDGLIKEWQLGNSLPFLERPVITRNFAMPITLDKNQEVQVYLRTESNVGVLVPLRLYTVNKFWGAVISQNMQHGLYFGVLLMFVAFNLGWYLFRNDSLYLILAADLAVFALMYANHLGLNFEYLWPVDPQFNYVASLFFGYLVAITANVFTWRFLALETKEYSEIKGMYYAFNISAVVGMFLLWLIPVNWSSYLCSSLGLVVAFYLVYLSYVSYTRRAAYALLYLFGYSVAALSACVYVLHKLALLPTTTFIVEMLGYSILLQSLILTSVMILRTKETPHILGFQSQTNLVPDSVRNWVAQFSHEIRTPLNGIVGMADLLKETPLNPTQYNYVRNLSSSGEHLVELVTDILDYESLAGGHVELVNKEFNVVEVCEQSGGLFTRSASEGKVDVTFQYQNDMPKIFCGDGRRFRQILLNLLNNSIKFSQGGRVVVSLGYTSNEELELKVWDDGIGMTKQQQKDIFLNFRQADSSVFQRFGGNGLGLAICEQLTTLMSGQISVESEFNEFCCFTVLLPMSSINVGKEVVFDEKPSPLFSPVEKKSINHTSQFEVLPKSLVVLGVDDNEINRRVLSAMLKKLGHTIIEAASGKEAIDIVRTGVDIDLILMDCDMPRMNGFEATNEIRQWQYGQADKMCRIIALTAHTLDEHKEKCLESGMDGHLGKPLHLQELRELIDQFT